MKTKNNRNKNQLKFGFEKPTEPIRPQGRSSFDGKVVNFDPKQELYKKILNRK